MRLEPLRMKSCYKEYLWGGTRLKRDFGKGDAPEMTAESWELACHPDGVTRVAEGPLAGKSLEDLDRLTPGDLLILKVSDEDDTVLDPIEDDAEYDAIAAIFEERLAGLLEFEDEDGE